MSYILQVELFVMKINLLHYLQLIQTPLENVLYNFLILG